MSRKYKFRNPSGIYFVSFATVFWVDVFTRKLYFDAVVERLRFCQERKGMQLFGSCIMTNHAHLIFRSDENDPSEIMRAIKTYTSNAIQKMIQNNPRESRRAYLLELFQRAAENKSNVQKGQFWRQDNQPIEIWKEYVFFRVLNYIHDNPVKAGFVEKPEHWKYSSAARYQGMEGLLELFEIQMFF